MHTTPISLLERLRTPSANEAWDRFVKLYTPLLYYWACRLGLQNQDAADLVQDVLTLLIQKLPEFQYDKSKSFRAWLRTVITNRWRNLQRRRAAVSLDANAALASDLASPESESGLEDEEYRQFLVGRALQILETEFQPASWKAFRAHMIEGKPAADVARELDISIDSVYAIKSRVLRRLRKELEGLLE
jgi:RNA polymerase sigma-70 factor (ECF subfamily)